MTTGRRLNTRDMDPGCVNTQKLSDMSLDQPLRRTKAMDACELCQIERTVVAGPFFHSQASYMCAAASCNTRVLYAFGWLGYHQCLDIQVLVLPRTSGTGTKSRGHAAIDLRLRMCLAIGNGNMYETELPRSTGSLACDQPQATSTLMYFADRCRLLARSELQVSTLISVRH